jgi:CheY-like chemotaxis protein
MDQPDKKTIVYADDDADDIELLKEAFDCVSGDVQLITCSNGVEVLHYLKTLSPEEPSPCLIILDINMPKLDGRKALANLRDTSRFAKTPVVIFSTSSHPHDKDFARQYDAGFISKPIEIKEMAKIADTFINHCTEEVKKSLRNTVSKL